MTPFSSDDARALNSQLSDTNKARLQADSIDQPFEIQRLKIDLTTARLDTNPFVIGFPFKSVFVRGATDPLTSINLIPITQDSYQSYVSLTQNDSLVFQRQIPKAYLSWSAQSGKYIELIFFVTAEFKSGSQLSVNGGGVSINEGSAFTTAVVALTAATATAVFAQNSLRKCGTFENETGADIWVGGSTVSNSGTTKGRRILPGAVFEWRNTAALYAYSVNASSIVTMEES